jgi:guanosine-3',5'-bis(diphosphate) 3'-pyrophosphohydrolase
VTAIGRALEIAMSAHDGQTDKAEQPYINHVLRVALAQTDPLRTVVALLHDVVEDTDVTLGQIVKEFGHDVADAVYAITKQKGETYKDYVSRVRMNVVALDVKMADILDNSDTERLALLPETEQSRLRKKYEETYHALRS